MNFKEAMAVISENVWVTNSEIDNEFVYRFKDGMIQGVNMEVDPSAWREQWFEKSEMRATWKIYKKPETPQSLWETNGSVGNMGYNFSSIPVFLSVLERVQWDKAMHTFLRLKSHPLARSWSRGNNSTWYICYDYINSVQIVALNNFPHCMSGLSPEFNSLKDALACVEDIGKKSLRKMFEVFQGIYE